MIPQKPTEKPAAKPTAKPDQGKPMDTAAFAAMIAELLGLPPETPPDELLAKLKDKIGGEPDPAKFVPVATVQAMLAERNLSLATASEERANRKVAEALRLGHIPQSMKDWATALCRSDEASFDQFVANSGPAFSRLLQPSHAGSVPPMSRQDRAGSDLADAICSQLGLKPGSLTE